MICCAKAPGWVKTENDRCQLFNLVAENFCWSTFKMMFHICRIWGHWHLCYLPGAATGAPPLGLFQAIVVSWFTSKPHILSHQIIAHVSNKHFNIEWNIVGPLPINNVKNLSKGSLLLKPAFQSQGWLVCFQRQPVGQKNMHYGLSYFSPCQNLWNNHSRPVNSKKKWGEEEKCALHTAQHTSDRVKISGELENRPPVKPVKTSNACSHRDSANGSHR